MSTKKIIEFFNAIEKSEKFNIKKELVRELTTLVSIHLEKEDTRLYPVLAESQIEEIYKLGRIFSMVMKNNSKDFMIFVETFLKSTGPNTEFENAYKNISEKIRNRITIEETILFPAYEKCV